MIKERPILFSEPMVDAILTGAKTVTRRVIKPQPVLFGKDENHPGEWWMPVGGIHRDRWECPYGEIGDRLWLREAWRVGSSDRNTIWYKDGCFIALPDTAENLSGKFLGDKWRPSIHMYRWASRIDLEITDVRIERLQDITEEDAKVEGVPIDDAPCDHVRFSCEDVRCLGPGYRASFCELWQKLNGRRGFGWNENPFVWRVQFKRIKI